VDNARPPVSDCSTSNAWRGDFRKDANPTFIFNKQIL
jgi:hypothetical protein